MVLPLYMLPVVDQIIGMPCMTVHFTISVTEGKGEEWRQLAVISFRALRQMRPLYAGH
jgi:hypothetical protein